MRETRGVDPALTGGVAWTAASTWGSSLITFAVMVGLARMVEPRAFGLIALAAVYIAIARVFVEQGFASALVQRRDLEAEHLDTAFWLAMAAAGLLSAASLLLAAPIAAAMGEPELAPIIRWLSPTLVLTALHGTQHAILQRQLAFRGLAIRSLIAAAGGGAVGLLAAAAGFGVWSLVAQALTGSALATAVLWGVSPWRPGVRVSGRHFRELFGFSGFTFGTALVAMFSRRADDLLIGWLLGPVALGYYVIAWELITAFADLLAGVATRVGLPAFSRLQDRPGLMRQGLYAGTRYITLIALPAFVGVMLVAPEFVPIVYGARWAAAVPLVQILALLGILHAAFAIQGTVLLAAGQVTWRLVITVIGVAANILAVLLAVRWGIVAVATATVARAYLLAPLPLLVLRRLIGLDLRAYLRQYRAPVLAAGAMAAGVLLLGALLGAAPPALHLVTSILAGMAIYVAALHLQERRLLRDLAGVVRALRAGPQPADAED